MILSRKWLNEFVDVSDISDREFDEAMTLSGSKVETVTALDESLKNVVVGKILSMEKHPDSDHMWICQIDVGQAEPTQIVTGAWNIHVGDLVPVAQHKSLLPNGTKIEKGKLRGVVSKLHSTNGAPEMQDSIWQAKANRRITLIMQQVPEKI